MVIAVIADIVGSRRLDDRATAQRLLDETVKRVEHDHPSADRPFTPTVGDEQQGVYARLEDAMTALLMLQLALPDGIELRFGLGVGEIRPVSTAHRELSDGPGWWAARAAIDLVHERQRRAVPHMRSWIVAAPGQDEVMASTVAASNAYLVLRDDIVSRMSGRERRLVYGRLSGRSQRALAEQEGVTQPAVSKALRSAAAAALIAGVEQLAGTDRPGEDTDGGAAP
ncbi:MAG: SatD family protein [Microbacterium sp.]